MRNYLQAFLIEKGCLWVELCNLVTSHAATPQDIIIPCIWLFRDAQPCSAASPRSDWQTTKHPFQ